MDTIVRPGIDAAVATRRPLPPPRPRPADAAAPNATIVARQSIGRSILRLRVRPDHGVPDFLPGQYMALGLPVDDRPLQRPYSTASSRGEADALEFLVRLVPAGELTPRLWPLGVGARIRLGRPKGLFVPDAGDPRRPVYIATGTGIAPLLSMLESRLRELPDGPARGRPIVVHGVAHAADLAGREGLEALAARGRITYVPAVSRPTDPANAGWPGATGRLDALLPDVLAGQAVDPAAAVAFICGNPAMTAAVSGRLVALGLPTSAIRTEAYWTPAAPPA